MFFFIDKIRLTLQKVIIFLIKIIVKMAYVISDDCTACGTCIDECPVEAISEGDIYKIDPELCTDCGACADVCPVEAISPE
jgi:ferredoxin